MRRTATVILAIAALAVAAVPALADHSTDHTIVRYTGPVTPGQELRLDCPEGYALIAGSADFYRDRAMRVPVALDRGPDQYVLWPHGGAFQAYVWVVPKGARFADAYVECAKLPPTTSFVKTGIFDGSTVTFYCPSHHPYFVGGDPPAAVVYGDEDANFETFPQYVIPYEILYDPDGIAFTGTAGHGYRATITCSTEPTPATTTTTVVPTTTSTPPSTTATTTVPTTSTTTTSP
jgi:hypothetical protein